MSARESRTGASVRDRSRARAWIIQILYGWEALNRAVPLAAVLETTLATRKIAPAREPYIRRVLEQLASHPDEVDRKLQDVLENWRLERLSSLDRQVLRLGAVEILYFADIPPRVSIQEAIRLAEKYGGDESVRFVNGVLDALLKRTESLSES